MTAQPSVRERKQQCDLEVSTALARAIESWRWGGDARRVARTLYDAQRAAARAFVESLGRRTPHWAALDRAQRGAWIALAVELEEIAHCSVQPS